jgi:hypothetical protein
MKVLLINPDVPDTFRGLKNALKLIYRKSILAPTGATDSKETNGK